MHILITDVLYIICSFLGNSDLVNVSLTCKDNYYVAQLFVNPTRDYDKFMKCMKSKYNKLKVLKQFLKFKCIPEWNTIISDNPIKYLINTGNVKNLEYVLMDSRIDLCSEISEDTNMSTYLGLDMKYTETYNRLLFKWLCKDNSKENLSLLLGYYTLATTYNWNELFIDLLKNKVLVEEILTRLLLLPSQQFIIFLGYQLRKSSTDRKYDETLSKLLSVDYKKTNQCSPKNNPISSFRLILRLVTKVLTKVNLFGQLDIVYCLTINLCKHYGLFNEYYLLMKHYTQLNKVYGNTNFDRYYTHESIKLYSMVEDSNDFNDIPPVIIDILNSDILTNIDKGKMIHTLSNKDDNVQIIKILHQLKYYDDQDIYRILKCNIELGSIFTCFILKEFPTIRFQYILGLEHYPKASFEYIENIFRFLIY
ncbi:hypothetical protein D3C87_1191130 [compost metagenome]